MRKLVSKLKEIQVANGLTDGEMAKRLNCSRQNYQKTRTGEIPLGNKLLKGISTAFPGLRKDVKAITNRIFLSCDANRIPEGATKSPLKQLSEAQGRGLKRFCVGLIRKLRNR